MITYGLPDGVLELLGGLGVIELAWELLSLAGDSLLAGTDLITVLLSESLLSSSL